jgi:hypothetical protein
MLVTGVVTYYFTSAGRLSVHDKLKIPSTDRNNSLNKYTDIIMYTLLKKV